MRAEAINGGEISPNHMELESTGTANPRARGYYPVSGGAGAGAGWSWLDAHGGVDIPAAEGINDPAVNNVFRVPASGTQNMQTGTIAFATLNASSSWGFIDRQSGVNTIMIDNAPSTWEDIATGANYNSFWLANGASGFSSAVTALVDTSDPETCGLVWFRGADTDSDWAIFQWPAHSLNQSGTGGIYTNERNLKLIASQGSPSASMQVGLNIGISPVRVDSDFIRIITDSQWFFGADRLWHDGYDYFDRAGSAAALGYEVDALEKELNAGIGKVPFPQESASHLTAPKEFNGLTIASNGRSMTFNMARPEDSELWSAFDDLFDDLLYPEDGLATIHFQMAHLDTDQADTEFTLTDIVFISANDGTNEIFDVDQVNDTFNFNLTNGAAFGSNNRITFSDGNGDVIPGDVQGFRTGPGYFRKLIAYRADNNAEPVPVDLTSQIDEIGYKSFAYKGTPPSPAIPVISTTDSEQTGELYAIGSGIQTSSNTLTANPTLTWDTSIAGNAARIIPNGVSANGVIINASDTVGWHYTDSNTQIAFVQNGSIDSELLDTDAVYARHLATTNAGTNGQYLRLTDNGLTWNTVSGGGGGGVTAGFGIELVGADEAITVDTDDIADTDWVKAQFRDTEYEFTSTLPGLVMPPGTGAANLDYALGGTGRWISSPTTTNKGLVPRFLSHADTELQSYFLDGTGAWRRVNTANTNIFTDTESGLVPASGGETGDTVPR